MTNQNKPLQQKVNIDISQADPLKCEQCDCEQFEMKYLIKKISALLSPTGEDVVIPIQVFACNACGAIPDDFLPSK